MKTRTFDRSSDGTEEIADHRGLPTARRRGTDPKRVNVELPRWMVDSPGSEGASYGHHAAVVDRTMAC
jgi:hypothetical protein